MGLVEKLTIGERVKARKLVKQVLDASTQTLIGARETLLGEGNTDLVECIDLVLHQRGVIVTDG